MAIILSFANQKSGVAKTTTAQATGQLFSKELIGEMNNEKQL